MGERTEGRTWTVNSAHCTTAPAKTRTLKNFSSKVWLGKSACGSLSPIYHLLASKPLGWWNGRHVRLRGVCRKACGFKSRPEHHRTAYVEISSSRAQYSNGLSKWRAGTETVNKELVPD